ncbi:hypothetical protein GBA52_005659 [Prunus armeniaca]|nr:hypothetical protein GBA52_005659 [Prunus armeniaca]
MQIYSTAGGTTTPTTPPATGIFGAPTTPTTPTFGGGSVTGFTPMTPTIPESDDNSKASLESMIPTILMHVSFMSSIALRGKEKGTRINDTNKCEAIDLQKS